MPYEYRVLSVAPDEWDQLQTLVDDLARAGFRYRDSLRRDSDRALLIFEREAVPATDAWAAAQSMLGRKPTSAKARMSPPDGPKYPPDDED